MMAGGSVTSNRIVGHTGIGVELFRALITSQEPEVFAQVELCIKVCGRSGRSRHRCRRCSCILVRASAVKEQGMDNYLEP